MADFDMFLNEGDEFGQSSQDKGKGKEKETVNEFPTPPQPNQNFPRPQIPYRWPTPVATNDNTDEPGTSDYSEGSAQSSVSVHSDLVEDRFCMECTRVMYHPLSRPICRSCEWRARDQASGAMLPPAAQRCCVVCARGIEPPAIMCKEHDEKTDTLKEIEINALKVHARMCVECGRHERDSSPYRDYAPSVRRKGRPHIV
jgi:hypothetical protein